MDNFRTPKRRSSGSVDGFVTGKYLNQRGGSDLRAFDQYYRPKNRVSSPGAPRRVDSFGRVDGFTPGVLPAIDRPEAAQRPTDIGLTFERTQRNQESQRPAYDAHVPKPKKKGLFGRRKHKADAKHHRHPKRRMTLRLAGVMAALLILVGGGVLLRGFLAGRNIFRGGGNSAILNNQNVDPAQLKGEGDGRVNILLLGKGGEEQSSGPDLTDTIIIASIDPIAKEAALLSIPRDFWVKSNGYQSKINEVYANAKYAALDNYSFKERSTDQAKDAAEKAGIDAIKRVVSDTMGVPVHYYATIDFAGFRKAIDTVGGIEIDVTEDMAVKETLWINGRNYNLNVPEGRQQFDGMRALAFSRSRKTSARGDFSRAERQRAVILGLKDKVLSTGTLANPLKINQLISDFGDQVSTDFSVNEILRIYDLAKEIPGDKVASVGLDEYVIGDQISGLSVQVPKAGTFNYTEIQNYVRNIMRDAFLKKEDAKIIILNGTETAGLATKKSVELKSFGYNILSVGDAPTKDYAKTVLIDLRNGDNKYTLSYLEKRLNLKATGVLPDNTIEASAADFVIILGSNETSSSQN